MSKGDTAIRRSLLWLMQTRKIKTKGKEEYDGAEGKRSQDKNSNQIHFLIYGSTKKGGFIPHRLLRG